MRGPGTASEERTRQLTLPRADHDVDAELVAWTLLEAEPWVEVFESGGDFTVRQRTT